MSPYVIWLDHQEAKLFKLLPDESEGKESKRLKLHGHKHVKHPFGKHEAHHHPDSDKFFGQVCEHIQDASELLVMGPGEGKVHFKAYLEKHFKSGLAKKIVGVETVDHPSDNQILEKARGFFKQYDLFH